MNCTEFDTAVWLLGDHFEPGAEDLRQKLRDHDRQQRDAYAALALEAMRMRDLVSELTKTLALAGQLISKGG